MQLTPLSLGCYAASVSKEIKKKPDRRKIFSHHFESTLTKLSYKIQEGMSEQMRV
jgi:hypothetical protein